jgi:hypothetical protein
MAGAEEIRWARRIRPEVIRRLYTLDAKGIVDEELIDEVGYAMYARCLSIQGATRAHFGRANCPRCRTEIRHGGDKAEVLACPCGWSTTWGEYHKTYQRRQLVGGAAYPMFKAFIERWPQARNPRDKLIEIDRLIHACHEDAQKRWARPAACNLIEGSMKEMIPFLDELAYGPQSTPALEEQRRAWAEKPQLVGWRAWRAGEAERPWGDGDDPPGTP